MGEDALDQTRLAVEAQRAELARTSDQLRESLNLKKRFQENPALFIGLGVGAVFLLAGGPVRVAKLVRRRAFRTDPEKAYDSLPKPMQDWVDHMAGAVGPRAAEARETLARELFRWRHDPRKHGKISKKLAEQIAEGPPGPERAGWKAFEAAAAIVTAALARKAVERFLSGEPPTGGAVRDALGTAGGATKPDREPPSESPAPAWPASSEARVKASSSTKRADEARSSYSSMSERDRS